ncbi:NUDIX hydrolase [Paenibacillus sp. MCAF20]
MIEITRYLECRNTYPLFFRQNENLKIIVDESELLQYAMQKKCKLGVLFENDYLLFVVDLIEKLDGSRYTYSRIINRNAYNGVVIIPVLNNKIVFLKQFRHGTREFEIELPRGFSEKSKTIEENAESEIFEELGVMPRKIAYLGNVVNDSGLSGGLVHVFVCSIEEIAQLAVDEGINDTYQYTIEEVEEFIHANIIRDCFSLSAIYKFITSTHRQEYLTCS